MMLNNEEIKLSDRFPYYTNSTSQIFMRWQALFQPEELPNCLHMGIVKNLSTGHHKKGAEIKLRSQGLFGS